MRSAPVGYAVEYPINEFSWVFSPMFFQSKFKVEVEVGNSNSALQPELKTRTIECLILYHLSLTLGLTDNAVFGIVPALFLGS